MNDKIKYILESLIELDRNCAKTTDEERAECAKLKEIAALARTVVADPLDYHAEDDDKSFT